MYKWTKKNKRSGKLKIGMHDLILILTHRDQISGKKIVEKTVVPPRAVVTQYPWHSTPLTVESTNYAFRDFAVRLTKMGFRDQAEAALVHTNAESVEAAVSFILDNPDALWHRFRLPGMTGDNSLLSSDSSSNNNSNKISIDNDVDVTDSTLCDACGIAYSEHLIDHKGEQVIKKSRDDTALFGDLEGRVSMSVATLKERQEQLTMQEQIKQRVHILNSLTEDNAGDSLVVDTTSKNGSDDNDDGNGLESAGRVDSDGKIHISAKMKAEIDNVLKEEKEKQKAITGPTETCLICFTDKSVDDFYRAPCGHNYCKECLQEHYKLCCFCLLFLRVFCFVCVLFLLV